MRGLCNVAFHSLCPLWSLQELSVQCVHFWLLCESIMGCCFGGCVLSGGLFHSLSSSRQWIVYSTSAECTFQKNSLGHQCSPVALCRCGGAMTAFTLLWIPGVVLAWGSQHKHLKCPWYFRFCLNSSRGSKHQFLMGNGIRRAGAVRPNCVINKRTVIPERQRNPSFLQQFTVYPYRAEGIMYQSSLTLAVIVHGVLPSYLPKNEGEISIYSRIENPWQCDFDRCC